MAVGASDTATMAVHPMSNASGTVGFSSIYGSAVSPDIEKM